MTARRKSKRAARKRSTKTKKKGRGLRLTPGRHRIIVEALRAGNSKRVAYELAGIGKSTFFEWLQRGADEPGTVFEKLLQEIERAACEFEAEALAEIRKTGSGIPYRETTVVEKLDSKGAVVERRTTTKTGVERAWTALAWILERTRPDVYARRIRQDLGGADGGPITLVIKREGPANGASDRDVYDGDPVDVTDATRKGSKSGNGKNGE